MKISKVDVVGVVEAFMERAEIAAERGNVPRCEAWIRLARQAARLTGEPQPAHEILLMWANKMALRQVIRLAA